MIESIVSGLYTIVSKVTDAIGIKGKIQKHMIQTYWNLRVVTLLLTLITITLLFIFAIPDTDNRLLSISAYYHTDLRDLFVGSLFSIGVMLVIYTGYTKSESILMTIGGIALIGVALCPTNINSQGVIENILHVFFAFLFFLSLAIFMYLSTRGDKGTLKILAKKLEIEKNKYKNLILRSLKFAYWLCAFTMIFCFMLLIGNEINLPLINSSERATLYLETVCIAFFGIFWGIKTVEIEYCKTDIKYDNDLDDDSDCPR